jgi:DNA-binding GntR family transcriptional regulator
MNLTGGPGFRHASLASIASDWIAQNILDGSIAPGEKITEDGLANQLGISRSPIREALRELSRDGLVIIEPRRGARVGELDRKHAEDLYVCRLMIEPPCIRFAVEAMEADRAEQLQALYARMCDMAEADDATQYVAALKDYNLALLDGCPNRLLFGLAETSWRGSLRYWNLLVRGRSDYMAQSLQRNGAVHAAAMKGDAARAERVAAKVLQSSGAELRRLLRNVPRSTPDRR